jgi:hypothetical protein
LGKLLDLGARGIDIAQKDRFPLRIEAEGMTLKIESQAAGQGVSLPQRRGSQKTGAHVGMDAAFEITVAGEHCRPHQPVFTHGFSNIRMERTGITNAGGAAIADHVETQTV